MFRSLVALVLTLFVSKAMAFHDTACAEKVWLTKGTFKKYELKYTNIDFISTKTSGEEGSSQVSTKSSTQGSTMSVDPGITTGHFESSTQYTSSYGDCSAWASNERWLRREYYVAENEKNIRTDMAKGDGEYLESLLYLSGCGADAKDPFARLMQKHYSTTFSAAPGWAIGTDVDRILVDDKDLRKICDLFPLAG